MQSIARFFIAVTRYILPVLSLFIVFGCFIPLLHRKRTGTEFALIGDDLKKHSVRGAEVTVGSAKDCDLCIDGLKPVHFVLQRKSNSYVVSPCARAGVAINGMVISKEMALVKDDAIRAGNREFTFTGKAGKPVKDGGASAALPYAALCLFQAMMLVSFVLLYGFSVLPITLGFSALIIAETVYFIVCSGRGCQVELAALYLVTVGLCVAARVSTAAFTKEAVCFAVGSVGAILLYHFFSNQTFAKGFRIPAAVLGIVLFIANVVVGAIYNGSQNWIAIGPVSFQPSEFIKVIFVWLGAVTAENTVKNKSFLLFALFTLFSLGCLAYLRDFGTALVYFAAFIAVLILRRVRALVIVGVCAGAGALGGLAMLCFPYVAKRIFSFSHAWENAYDSGYQQVKNMVAVASGGLFGRGTGEGTLSGIAASDTDLVFGFVCEEWGLIIGLCVAVSFALFLLYTVKQAGERRLFYAVPACAAAVIYLVQASLNIFGSLDMLPFTGVTLPFVSNGGSSMICCMLLLAFIRPGRKETV